MNELQTFPLRGEVVEIFERNGIALAKIAVQPLHLELPMTALDAAHLGDTVHLTVQLSVRSIETTFGFDDCD